MKLRSFILLFTLIGLSGSIQAAGIDGSSIINMNSAQKTEFARFLTTKQCTCGCRLTVAVCLRTMKTCQHAPRMWKTKIQQLWAKRRSGAYRHTYRNPARRTYPGTTRNPTQRTGRLDRALFGEWSRRTNNGGFYSTKIYTFLPNGIVTWGSSAAFTSGGGGYAFRNPRNAGISYVGRWHVKGNIIYMKWRRGTSNWYKYKVFPHYKTFGVKIGSEIYTLVRRR